jgi:hypothetical protein
MQNRAACGIQVEISDSIRLTSEIDEIRLDFLVRQPPRPFATPKLPFWRQIPWHLEPRAPRMVAMRVSVLKICVSACLLAAFSAGALLLRGAAASPDSPSNLVELRQAFAHPPDDSRIMVRWWWFGTAVEKTELARELRTMKEGGIGGVEVQPVYPVVLDDPSRGLVNLPYLSDGFLDALRFANDQARELGLRMDITLGSGWPYGGPHTPVEQASARLRYERGPNPPTLGAGEKLIGTVDGVTFIASRTRQMVKRPAAGAEGWVLDHYNRAAIENHLSQVGSRLMTAFGDHPPYAVFSDSLEVYGADWTNDFLEQFDKRRGYDLTPHLPALLPGAPATPETASIRHDWGLTLDELANENYLTPIREWAAAHGTRFRSQTYGIPPVNLSSNALVDLPEGEEGGGANWKHFTPVRWASSASHLYGRPVTSSETFTWLHSPVFRATPLDMKAEADLHFLQGINQIICHGWPYSPPQAGEPGWHFYAAAVFNNHNPWWIVMPDVTAYLQRVSFLLRQGQPANDVAVYLPTDDAYATFQLSPNPRGESRASVNGAMDRLIGRNVIPQLLEGGYNFDYIDDGAIGKVGVPYPVLILPNVERIPLATMEKIAEYARKGGIVLATGHAPSLAPGLMDQKDTPKIRELAASLRVIADDGKLAETLRTLYKPDVDTAPEINFIHRKLPYADIYFVVNTTNHAVHHQTVFRVKGAAESWDPFTGKIDRMAPSTDLNLSPYESRVFVFFKGQSAAAAKIAGGPVPIDLSNNWKVTVGNNQPITMETLQPWPDKFYSGTATYEKTVRLEAVTPRLYLDFGEGTPMEPTGRRSNGFAALLDPPVREAAVVYVNSKRAGSVWCPPYQVQIGPLLHRGENQIRIVVANLAINELANQPLPDYRPLIAKYGDRFQDQDLNNLQPLPSGLLGAIRLVAR